MRVRWGPLWPRRLQPQMLLGMALAMVFAMALVHPLGLDAPTSMAFVGLMGLGAAQWVLRRQLGALQRLADFARDLAERPGAMLDEHAGSREVAALTASINHASRTLHAQWDVIRAGKDSLQAILYAVPDAVMGVQPDGSLSLLSPATASVFGCSTSGADAPQHLAQLVPELDAQGIERRALSAMFVRSSGARVARFESMGRRADGVEFPVEVSLSRTEVDGRVQYTCIVRDITEQRYALDMLNLSQRALDCTSNGVLICETREGAFPIFYANPAVVRITGYAEHEVVGRNPEFLLAHDRDQPEAARLRSAVLAGESASAVLRHYRKDGSLFFAEVSVAPVATPEGRVTHYVGAIADVTERERARLAIAERSARLNAVFDLSPDGFVVFDREGRMVYANQAFGAMTGMQPLDSGDGARLADFDRAFALSCAVQEPHKTVAASLADHDDGSPVTLAISRPQRRVLSRAVRRTDDRLGETILYFRDITHETEVDRMKSEFLTTAAHELRTPMVSVFGFTELLLRRPVPEDRRRDMLETIHRQTSVLIHMVNELLDLARIEARQGKDLRREPCRLGALVQEAAAAFAGQPGGERLDVALSDDRALLLVDPEKTLRVFTNVLSNAFKYSPRGGAVEVRSSLGHVNGRPAVCVQVSDRGIGMTHDQLARVFERFYRADPSGNIPGTGLGMSLVKEIVELQDGAVHVDSEPDEGTQVRIWLPLHDSATVPA